MDVQEITNTYYRTHDLRSIIQASDEQLCKALKKLPALELNGNWRMLHPDYHAQLTDALLDTIVASRMKYDELDAVKCVSELNDLYPDVLVRHTLSFIATPIIEEDEQHKIMNPFEKFRSELQCRFWKLSPAQVCRFRAQQLFAVREPYPEDDFLEQLKNNIPFGMSVELGYLRGMAICDEIDVYSTPANKIIRCKAWKYYPIHSLSPSLRVRLDQLFQERKRWLLPEIEPYLEDVCLPGQTVDQLLIKYARAVTENRNGVSQGVYMKR
jgi:sister chromatid cohesion protein DCC1